MGCKNGVKNGIKNGTKLELLLFSFSFFVLRYCLRNLLFLLFFYFLCYCFICLIIIIVPLSVLNRFLLLFGILFFRFRLPLMLACFFHILFYFYFCSSLSFLLHFLSPRSIPVLFSFVFTHKHTYTKKKRKKKSANIYPCAEKHTTEIRANLRISTRLRNEATKTKRGGKREKKTRILPRGLQKLLRGRTSLDPVAVTWEKRHSARGTLA